MAINTPDKPSIGSWTALYPELGTDDVSYEDSVCPEFFEKEKAGVFKRSWLNIGRVERLPKVGSYFTKDLPILDTSVLVVKGKDNKVRAFHNMCSHRGNKLVWDENPSEPTSGTCRVFQCKYHAWRFGLEGDLVAITREEEFFGIDKSKYGLSPINCEVWEGFIFINLDENPGQTLKEFLGEMGEGLEGYPYHKFTQVYGYRAVVNANWKEFSDSFSETYHSPFLHGGMSTEMADGIATADATLFKIMAPHGVASWREFPREHEQPTPIEKVMRAGLFGPWDQAELGLTELPKGINELRDDQWGIDSNQIFPNLVILFWERGWYMTYHYWPLTVDSHLFECYQYFIPPKNASERLQQELSVAMSREYAFQDANTLEATHSMLKTRVKKTFPLCDQELLPRNLHYRITKAVADWEAEQTAKLAALDVQPAE